MVNIGKSIRIGYVRCLFRNHSGLILRVVGVRGCCLVSYVLGVFFFLTMCLFRLNESAVKCCGVGFYGLEKVNEIFLMSRLSIYDT